MGLMARQYMCLLSNVYLYFCVSYNNFVSFNKIAIHFYISDENVNVTEFDKTRLPHTSNFLTLTNCNLNT